MKRILYRLLFTNSTIRALEITIASLDKIIAEQKQLDMKYMVSGYEDVEWEDVIKAPSHEKGRLFLTCGESEQ